MKLISIIIPTYNRLWSLPETIDSCRSKNGITEIIVVDDGSSDGTWEWLQTQQDIVKIKQPNQGKCWAANKGVEIATGKYIKFLDSDDKIDPIATEEQLQLAEAQQADLVVSGYKVFADKQILREQKWIYCDDFIAQQLGECDSSHYSSYLFRKDFIADIPHRPDFAYRDDRLFVIEAALKNPVVAVHDGYALLHRKHENERLQFPDGLKQSVQNFQHLEIYKRAFRILKAENKLTKRRIVAGCNILWPLAHWIAKTHLKEATEVYNWIVELNPDFVIPEKGAIGLLYSKLGFGTTEKILTIRRKLKFGLWN